MSEAKPFVISRWEVLEAYKRVKANQGAAGVDEQSIADFERNLKGNLYKIWNRMSSGSYFPPPVRTVEIPKDNGGERQLGIPTVSDRIAQMVVLTHSRCKRENQNASNSAAFNEIATSQQLLLSRLPLGFAAFDQRLCFLPDTRSWRLDRKSTRLNSS